MGVSKTLLLIMPKRRQVFNKLARLFLASLLFASVVGTPFYGRTLALHANIRIERKNLPETKTLRLICPNRQRRRKKFDNI